MSRHTASDIALSSSPDDDLNLLRHLVLGEEQTSLRQMKEQMLRLEEVVRGQEVRMARAFKTQEKKLRDDIGPNAFRWLQGMADSAEHYDSVGHMMAGPLEAALRVSANQNREGLAHTLAPVIGPGVRASVAEFFRKFVEQLDAMLRGANLPQRLWWRMAAAREGVPYSEYVIRKTARYAVVAVQLIEKSTGELICEVTNNATHEQSASFASQGMLTSSLMGQPVPEWESLRLTGRRLAMQLRTLGGGGEHLRGSAGSMLKLFEENLRDSEQIDQLPQARIDSLRCMMEALLVQGSGRKRRPWLGKLVVAGMLAGLGWWGVVTYQTRHREADLVAQLRKLPGVVVTETNRDWGKLTIHGLLDPLAPSIEALPEKFQLNPDSVSLQFSPWQSTKTPFEAMRRAEQASLMAGAQDSLEARLSEQNELFNSLLARNRASIEKRILTLLGTVDPSAVKLEWRDDALKISGTVPESIGVHFREEAARMSGMVAIDLADVKTTPELPDPSRLLESTDIPFVNGTLQFEAEAPEMIRHVADLLRKLDSDAPVELRYRLRAWPITGERAEGNLSMQVNRLAMVRAQLQALGYPVERFGAGVAETESLTGRRGVWIERTK